MPTLLLRLLLANSLTIRYDLIKVFWRWRDMGVFPQTWNIKLSFLKTAKSYTDNKRSFKSVLSCFTYVWLFVTPWTVAHQASLSMGFSRQEYWSGLGCHSLLQGIQSLWLNNCGTFSTDPQTILLPLRVCVASAGPAGLVLLHIQKPLCQ